MIWRNTSLQFHSWRNGIHHFLLKGLSFVYEHPSSSKNFVFRFVGPAASHCGLTISDIQTPGANTASTSVTSSQRRGSVASTGSGASTERKASVSNEALARRPSLGHDSQSPASARSDMMTMRWFKLCNPTIYIEERNFAKCIMIKLLQYLDAIATLDSGYECLSVSIIKPYWYNC